MTQPPSPPPRALPPLDVPDTAAEQLRLAKRRLHEANDLLAPGTQGRLGCGLAGAYVGTAVLFGVVIVAPCSLGLLVPIGGVFGAIGGLVVGGVIGVPAVLRLSRRVRAAMYRRALATLERRALPKRAGGGSSTTAAVSPVDRDDADAR